MSSVTTSPAVRMHGPHDALHGLQHWFALARPGHRAAASWLDRLAAWAERQPVHHRLGSYQRLR